MSENRDHQNEFMAAYTFDRLISAGVHLASYRDDQGDNFALGMPMTSILAFRDNEAGRQTNLYLGVGIGGLLNHDVRAEKVNKAQVASALFVDADTETRAWYGAFRLEKVRGGDQDLSYFRLRGGVAPFLAEFSSLHTWIILQADYDLWRKQGKLSPMLRFFFQNVLWELGSSLNGAFQFNWTVEL